MQTTSWNDLEEFIRARNPDFLRLVRGVSHEHIELCQQASNIVLPKLYVEFLALMGADCAKFRPFGASQCCEFYSLVEMLPSIGYPAKRYFKVAYEDDASGVTWYDTFIDLERSNGNDAALVQFEDVGVFDQDNVIDINTTLSDAFFKRSFNLFELDLRPFIKNLYIAPYPEGEVDACKAAVLELMSTKGLVTVWSPLARVACLRNKGMSVIVEHTGRTQVIAVRIGGTMSAMVGVLIEQLRDLFPDAVVSDD